MKRDSGEGWNEGGQNNSLIATTFFGFGGGQKGRGEFFVEGKKEFHALAVGVKFFWAVAEVNGAIQFRVRFGERGRHGEA